MPEPKIADNLGFNYAYDRRRNLYNYIVDLAAYNDHIETLPECVLSVAAYHGVNDFRVCATMADPILILHHSMANDFFY